MNTAFNQLVKDAAGCTLCPAMCGRSAVLSELNGSPEARVMFIGEAPGRKGADRTRVPFSGDQSGANLDRFLSSIKLTRQEIFITSAALCNPRSESGANRKPTQKELANCSACLRRTIEIVNPRLIVTLGSVALEALKRIELLEKKMLKAEKKKFEAAQRQIIKIKANLFPGGTLQERVDNLMPFYALWGKDFIEMLYEHSQGVEQEFCILEEK